MTLGERTRDLHMAEQSPPIWSLIRWRIGLGTDGGRIEFPSEPRHVLEAADAKDGAAWMPSSGVSVDDKDVAVATMSNRVGHASLDETLHAAHTAVADYDEIR